MFGSRSTPPAHVIPGSRKPTNGFTVHPRRWVVDRTNGWINHCRRLDCHYEFTLAAHEGFLILSQIALLLRRLGRSQLFDTLYARNARGVRIPALRIS
jgi:transposase